jgi:hypothetical protein
MGDGNRNNEHVASLPPADRHHWQMAEGNGNTGHVGTPADRRNWQLAKGNGNNGHVATPADSRKRQMAKHPFSEEDDSALFANNPVSQMDDKSVFHFLNTNYGRWANNPVLEDGGNSPSAKTFASEADNWQSASNPFKEETYRRSENGEWLSATCSGAEVDNGQEAANFPASQVNDAKYTTPKMKKRRQDAHSPALYEDDSGRNKRTTLRLGRSKRNPGCMRQCLLLRLLHPSQCHFIC